MIDKIAILQKYFSIINDLGDEENQRPVTNTANSTEESDRFVSKPKSKEEINKVLDEYFKLGLESIPALQKKQEELVKKIKGALDSDKDIKEYLREWVNFSREYNKLLKEKEKLAGSLVNELKLDKKNKHLTEEQRNEIQGISTSAKYKPLYATNFLDELSNEIGSYHSKDFKKQKDLWLKEIIEDAINKGDIGELKLAVERMDYELKEIVCELGV